MNNLTEKICFLLEKRDFEPIVETESFVNGFV